MEYLEISKQKFSKMQQQEKVTILAFESSCDETSVAIVQNGRKIFSNIVASQIDIHTRFGGVVPEIASRNHIMSIKALCKEALCEAKMTFDDIDAIAVTYGAGLIGALMVGVNYAKALAYSLKKPLLAVNHIHGHIAANYLTHENLTPPFLCCMVSGGHTAIINIEDYTKFKLVGTTVDDAAGEAFDKIARVLGLGYPGGPKVDKMAKNGSANIDFINHAILKDSFDFSFSGIKTSVINYINNKKQKNEKLETENICASFQKTIVDEIVQKSIMACKEYGMHKLVAAGGVAANSFLAEALNTECKKNNIELFMPKLSLCTDNAAMIASAAYYNLKSGLSLADLSLGAKSRIDF